MASTTSQELTVDASISAFLIRHGADREFRKVCELVRASFPALIGLEVMLQQDPDEDGRAQAVVCAKLPEVYPDDRLQASMRRYHERLIAELPLAFGPIARRLQDGATAGELGLSAFQETVKRRLSADSNVLWWTYRVRLAQK